MAPSTRSRDSITGMQGMESVAGCVNHGISSVLFYFHSFLATGDLFWSLHTRFRQGATTISSIVYQVHAKASMKFSNQSA